MVSGSALSSVESLVLVVGWGEHPEGGVPAPAVVERLDVVEHCGLELAAGGPGVAVDELLLERGEERLRDGVVPAHTSHDCERFEVIVKGSIDVGDRSLYPGDIMTASAGELYGPNVAGPQGCTTVEVFARQSGLTARIEHELDDGSRVGVSYIRGEQRPDHIAGMEDVEGRVRAVLEAATALESGTAVS